MNAVVYLDHAATSWPKPPGVLTAMQKAMEEAAANPGRGSHQMAVQASRVLFETRRVLAQLFRVKNPNNIIFTHNTTQALNMAIKGILKSGDYVVATMIEHNSVRRPLEYLMRTLDIQVDYIGVNDQGELDMQQLEACLSKKPRLVVCSHSSNLLGSILPIQRIGELARSSGAVFLVDAAQSAGVLDIDVESCCIDMLAFPGHKGLLGPQGTGGLYLSPEIELEPLIHGGTGSQSEEKEMPSVRPDRYEAGTLNTIGIAGLRAGVEYVLRETPQRIYEHEWALTQMMIDGLKGLPGMNLLGPAQGKERTGIVAFTIEGRDSTEIAFRLDRQYGIAVRAGMHCTPLAHYAVRTDKTGAVRASVGANSTEQEVQRMVEAMRELVR